MNKENRIESYTFIYEWIINIMFRIPKGHLVVIAGRAQEDEKDQKIWFLFVERNIKIPESMLGT